MILEVILQKTLNFIIKKKTLINEVHAPEAIMHQVIHDRTKIYIIFNIAIDLVIHIRTTLFSACYDTCHYQTYNKKKKKNYFIESKR